MRCPGDLFRQRRLRRGRGPPDHADRDGRRPLSTPEINVHGLWWGSAAESGWGLQPHAAGQHRLRHLVHLRCRGQRQRLVMSNGVEERQPYRGIAVPHDGPGLQHPRFNPAACQRDRRSAPRPSRSAIRTTASSRANVDGVTVSEGDHAANLRRATPTCTAGGSAGAKLPGPVVEAGRRGVGMGHQHHAPVRYALHVRGSRTTPAARACGSSCL